MKRKQTSNYEEASGESRVSLVTRENDPCREEGRRRRRGRKRGVSIIIM